MLHLVIMSELDLAQQIETEKSEDHNPDGQVDLSVKKSPVIGLVGRREKLETKSNLYESNNDLYSIEPSSALRQLLQQRGEEGEYRKRKRKGYRERQHRDDWRPELTLCRLDQHGPDNRSGAGERHKHESQCQEKYASETLGVCFRVGLVDQLRRHRNLERTEEGCGKDHKHQEEDDVRQPVRSKPVEYVGCHGISTYNPCHQDNNRYGQGVQCHDEYTVHGGSHTALGCASLSFKEVGHSHRHHREHARCQKSGKAPEDSLEDKSPDALALSTGRSGS